MLYEIARVRTTDKSMALLSAFLLSNIDVSLSIVVHGGVLGALKLG